MGFTITSKLTSVWLTSQVFLKSDRVAKMVQSGGFSAGDFREVFKRHIEKRVRSLPEIDGLSKETVLSSWMAKFDTIYRGDEDPRKAQQRMTASAASELILSKDQLYEMFQNILGIKKFEHQLLYQACQVRSGAGTSGCFHTLSNSLTATLNLQHRRSQQNFIFYISIEAEIQYISDCLPGNWSQSQQQCVLSDASGGILC